MSLPRFTRHSTGPYTRLIDRDNNVEIDRKLLRTVLDETISQVTNHLVNQSFDVRYIEAVSSVFSAVELLRTAKTNEKCMSLAEALLNFSNETWEEIGNSHRVFALNEVHSLTPQLLQLFHWRAASEGKGEFISPLVDAAIKGWKQGSGPHDVELVNGQKGSIKACGRASQRYIRISVESVKYEGDSNRDLTLDEIKKIKDELTSKDQYLLVYEDISVRNNRCVLVHRLSHTALEPFSISRNYGVRCSFPEKTKYES